MCMCVRGGGWVYRTHAHARRLLYLTLSPLSSCSALSLSSCAWTRMASRANVSVCVCVLKCVRVLMCCQQVDGGRYGAHSLVEIKTSLPTDRQADRRTYRWTERKPYIHTYRQTDRQTDRPTDRPTDRQTERQTDRQTDRQKLIQKVRIKDRKTKKVPLIQTRRVT